MRGIESLLVDRTLADRYHVQAVLGRGGMGCVYRALDRHLGRPVALKVITAGGGVDADALDEIRQRFRHEARAAARLHHPNVVTLYDFGTDATLGLDFLVLELLEGCDLATRLARGGALPAAEALEVVRQAAAGLAAGHAAGLIHRDVKPGNLFLAHDADGALRVRVLDFGIAQAAFDAETQLHLTRAGGSPFTPAYASPEQHAGAHVLTPASDVYGLGAVGFELLTGQKLAAAAAARGESPAATARALLAGLPGLDEGARAALCRALEPRPEDRFGNAAALLSALQGRAPAPGAPEDTTLLPAAAPAAAAERRKPALLPVRRPTPIPRPLRMGVAALALGGLVVTVPQLRGAADAFGRALAAQAGAVDAAPFRLPAHLVVPPPRPRWEVVGVEVDGACDSIFDRCVTVHCQVANTGEAGGAVVVEALLTRETTGESVRKRMRGYLEPRTEEVLSMDFPEYGAGIDYRFDCTARRG